MIKRWSEREREREREMWRRGEDMPGEKSGARQRPAARFR